MTWRVFSKGPRLVPIHTEVGNNSSEIAKAIYQRVLDDIGMAIKSKDVASYTKLVSLPHRIETFEETTNIDTPEKLSLYFTRTVQNLEDLNVPELSRSCTMARFLDADTIRGTHETKLIDRRMVIVDEYFSLTTLTLEGQVWKVSVSHYAEAKPSIPSQVIRGT